MIVSGSFRYPGIIDVVPICIGCAPEVHSPRMFVPFECTAEGGLHGRIDTMSKRSSRVKTSNGSITRFAFDQLGRQIAAKISGMVYSMHRTGGGGGSSLSLCALQISVCYV